MGRKFKRTIAFSYGRMSEQLLETPYVLPIAEPSKYAQTYTVTAEDMATVVGADLFGYSQGLYVSALFGINGSTTSARTFYAKFYLNDVAVSGNVGGSVSKNYYQTCSCIFVGIKPGDVIGVKAWMTVDDTTYEHVFVAIRTSSILGCVGDGQRNIICDYIKVQNESIRNNGTFTIPFTATAGVQNIDFRFAGSAAATIGSAYSPAYSAIGFTNLNDRYVKDVILPSGGFIVGHYTGQANSRNGTTNGEYTQLSPLTITIHGEVR